MIVERCVMLSTTTVRHFLPRTHVQGVEQSVLSVVVVIVIVCRRDENRHISRSRHLSDT